MVRVRLNKAARVCIVGGHPLAASYLTALMRRDPHWKVVELNTHSNPHSGRRISVFVIDAGSLPGPLHECVSRLRTRDPDARFIVLDRQNMDAGRLLNLRIQGSLTYDEVPQNLPRAVRTVLRDGTWVRPEMVGKYLNTVLVAHNGGFANHNSLTIREMEVMEFVKKRLSNAEIARHLGIRDSTVKFHMSNLFSKLHVSSRRELLDREDAVELWNNLLLYSALPHS